MDCAINSGTSWFRHKGLFLINLDFTLRKLQGFLTKLPASLLHNKFKQSQIFDTLRGLSDPSLSSMILKISLTP